MVEAEESQERAEKELGFWFWLMSDAVIFALLFMTYETMQGDGHGLFRLRHTVWETMLLLLSTATFGAASVAIGARRRGWVLAGLAVTFGLGAGFVVLELTEFADLVGRGAGPAKSGFLSAFFTLVGTHGLHVTAGLLGIAVLGLQVALRGVTEQAASRLHRLGMFWHFLDIIWIAIFTLVYLPGVL